MRREGRTPDPAEQARCLHRPHAGAAAAAAATMLLAIAGCAPSAPVPLAPTPDPVTIESGVSLELARARSRTLSDVAYDLVLDVRNAERAAGEVTIRFTRAQGAGALIVDFRGPELGAATANGQPLHSPAWEAGHIRVPAAALQPGANEVHFAFQSEIAPAGAPIIRYDDETDGSRYLYTLLVPADANALFPSFDQPDLKASVRLEVIAPAAWSVVANGPLEQRKPLGDAGDAGDAVRWRFAPTEPISTYLIAFAAGPWAEWSAPTGERPMTLYARRSRASQVDADTLLRINRDALLWLERRFGAEYPFAKLDLVLAPAFPFGGMEHVGAIFYNESRFIFREEPTLSQRLGRKSTIYHEVAHQWFGDYVTMEWFDDLWLKEGFATFTAAKMQDELEPGSGAWKTFYLRNKPSAYATDATRGTTPVWQELPNLDLAKSNYGPIVYNKAPSILKQLEFRVGEDAFWRGVGRYLRDHAYGNATWQDLLTAIEAESGSSLKQWGEQFILRAGMPRIETALEIAGDTIAGLRLTQKPAREMPGFSATAPWPMRTRVRLAYSGAADTTINVALDQASASVDGARGLPAPSYVLPNDGDFGYGLFLLDERSAEHLLAQVGTVDDDLRRAMVWGSLWEAVRERQLSPAAWLDAARRELPREGDEQIAAYVLGRAAYALQRYLSDEQALRALPAWEALVAARAADDALPYGMRKESLDALIELARTPGAVGRLRGYLAGEVLFDGQPLKQPSRWAIVRTLLAQGAPLADSLFAAEQQRDTTPEMRRQAFIASAAVPSTAAKRALFDRYLDDESLNEEWVTASLGAFNDPARPDLTLPFLGPSLERLEWIRENRRIFFLPQWINSFVGVHGSERALRITDEFLASNPELPDDLRRKLLQARDELERTVLVRAAFP